MAYYSADHAAPSSSFLADLGSAVLRRLAQVRSYRSTRDELEKLSDRELSDLGLTRYDIQAIAAEVATHH